MSKTVSKSYLPRPAKVYENTPFMEQTLQSVELGEGLTHFAKAPTMMNTETGEILEGNLYGLRRQCDKAEFVKIYKQGIKEMLRLPTGAVNVLGVLLEEYRRKNTIKNKEPYIEISYRAAVVDHEYPNQQKSWISGINHLIVQGLIAPSVVPNRYFVNTAYFFKGDRYAFVKEYQRKSVTDPKAALPHGPDSAAIAAGV